jgi:hypothetical protein
VKKQVSPLVFVGIALVVVGLVVFFGVRSLTVEPKLSYPKNFNPARPPGALPPRR